MNGHDDEKTSVVHEAQSAHSSEIDLLNYHEHNAGRLVVTPECVLNFCLLVYISNRIKSEKRRLNSVKQSQAD